MDCPEPPNHEPEEDAPEEHEATLEEQLKDVRLVATITTTHPTDITLGTAARTPTTR